MFKNVFYDYRQSIMHLWYTVRGEHFYANYHWVPYVFVPGNGNVTSIYGKPMIKKWFKTYYEYKEYLEQHTDNKNIHENKVKPEIQFLAEGFHDITEVPEMKIYSIDIEIDSDIFPDPQAANDKIFLISVHDMNQWKTYVFGEKPYTGNMENIEYVECKTEEILLSEFLTFMKCNPCDVITGWNCYFFDIPYIVNRTKKLFGEDTKLYHRLSPIKHVNTWRGSRITDSSGRTFAGTEFKIDIGGVSILDYMDIYKKYGKKLESYSLNFVSFAELEKGKLDYSENAYSLKELYSTNWNKMVEYNVIDAKRVAQLENKLGYIKMIQSLSLLTKTPMICYQTQTSQIEGHILSHLRKKNMCAPPLLQGYQMGYDAAYVKEPQVGIYNWVLDIDVMSEYPTAIIALNMSTETYFGKILGLKEDEIIEHTANKNFPPFKIKRNNNDIFYDSDKVAIFNKALKVGKFTIAPNGAIFTTNKTGIISEIEYNLFIQRQQTKKEMLSLEKDGQNKDLVDQLDRLQNAQKTILNSIYGIMATPYSRYANVDIAEAITACGRHVIKSSEGYINDILNNPNQELKTILDELRS